MAAITFNKAYAGYVYSGAGTVYHRREDGGFSGVDVYLDGDKDGSRVVATGLTTTAKDGNTMIEVQGIDDWYTWIDVSSGAWTRGKMATLYSQAEAQSYVDKLIDNNKQILMNNLFCARFADKLTEAEKETLYGLQARLIERNNRLMQDGYVSGAQSSVAYGYDGLAPALKRFMLTDRVGLVVSTTAIVISCVVIASVATAAYFAYKYYWAQSAQDVKYSDKLTKTLMAKLTQEEYDQLMAETQGIVTKASLRARLGNTWDIAKIAIMAFGIYTIYSLVKTTPKRKKHGIPASI